MDQLRDHLKKRIHQKKLTKQTAGAYIFHILKEHLHYPDRARGKLVGDIFTLYCGAGEDKTVLFHKRVELINQINDRLVVAQFDNAVSKLLIK